MEIEQSKAQLTASSWNATTQNPQIQEPNKQKQVDEDEKVLIIKPNSNDSLSYETKLKLNAKANIRKDYVDDNFMFPPGYRFCPYDEELIMHYLRKKVMNQPLPHNKIIEVNLYQHSPQELSEKYPVLGEKEWYFFTPRDRKYPFGNRPNRAAGTGYWKATGADKPIKYKDVKVGFRKALVFYEGKPPKGDKTNWIMHEFRVNESRRVKQNAKDMRLDDWVLCRIYKKVDKSFKSTRKEHEQQYASRSCSSVGKMDNCDYEGTVDSSIVASQNFEPPYQYDITFDDHIMDYTKYNPDYFSHSLGYGARSNYGMVQPSFSPGSVFWDQKVYQESINFPMHFEFPNYYHDPYENMDELQSQNVLGSVFDNSSMDKLG